MNLISRLFQDKAIDDIAYHFSRFIAAFADTDDTDVLLAAALVSHATANGDVCLDLGQVAGTEFDAPPDGQSAVVYPEYTVWKDKLSKSSAVGRPGDYKPLILDRAGRLYLYRYWAYEQRLANAILRLKDSPKHLIHSHGLKKRLSDFFPESADSGNREQRLAAVVSLIQPFSIITGGPGTGKTTVVGKIIALMTEQWLPEPPRIVLAAPTGKAAVRLAESIKKVKSALNLCHEISKAIPDSTTTIHRLLQPVPGTPYFRYHSENPLPVDMLVVDEASMVDTALMAKLMDAMPKEAAIIIIGDKDQLASVEAGSVLGDICDRNRIHRFSRGFCSTVENLLGEKIDQKLISNTRSQGLQDHIVHLQKSFRFSEADSIAAFSRSLNAGEDEKAWQILNREQNDRLDCKPVSTRQELFQEIRKIVKHVFIPCITAPDPSEAITRFNHMQILCAVKKGDFGVDGINRMIESLLVHQGWIQRVGDAGGREADWWYHGKPILIIRNDYRLNLFNGDLGITFAEGFDDRQRLSVYFPSPDGGIRQFSINQLPAFETAFAMTVHKSQGSEFNQVILVLPQRDNPLLTRELLYTGATRARKKLLIWGREEVFRTAVRRKIIRHSGLRDALWGAGQGMPE